MSQIDESMRPFPRVSLDRPTDHEISDLIAGAVTILRTRHGWINAKTLEPIKFFDGMIVRIASPSASTLFRVRLLHNKTGVEIAFVPLPP